MSELPGDETFRDLSARLEMFPILRYFNFTHLKSPQAEISEAFHGLAHYMTSILEPGPETSAMLRKLLEAKDCAVRASL